MMSLFVKEEPCDISEDPPNIDFEGGLLSAVPPCDECSIKEEGAIVSNKPKRKKPKGRNGNIYIGVINRIEWLKLQEKFGFDNINNFGNFIIQYMNKVYEDFSLLHQVALNCGLFDEHGLAGFEWMNGVPHPVNNDKEFIQLPEIPLTEDVAKKAFEIAYDLAIQRGSFLVQMANNNQNQSSNNNNNNNGSNTNQVMTEPDATTVDMELDQTLAI